MTSQLKEVTFSSYLLRAYAEYLCPNITKQHFVPGSHGFYILIGKLRFWQCTLVHFAIGSERHMVEHLHILWYHICWQIGSQTSAHLSYIYLFA